MGERLLGYISKGSMRVAVVEVDRMTGYRFDAMGKESLPLAVELAHLQAKSMRDSNLEEWSQVENLIEGMGS